MPPWDNDAAAYFGDDTEAIEKFNRYMTEKQQPYVTSLEEGSKDARELWTDLNADPEKTLRDLYASVYEEQPERITAYDAIFTPAEEAAIATAEAEPVSTRSDDEKDLLEWARAKRQAEADAEIAETRAADYVSFKDELKETHKLSDVDMGLIDPFIMIANSDGDAAVAALRDFQARFLAAHGVEAKPADLAPVAPPVLGTDGAPVAPPAKTPYTSYNQIGDALKDYQSRQAASSTPPPVVG